MEKLQNAGEFLNEVRQNKGVSGLNHFRQTPPQPNILFMLPRTNAGTERVFSQLNITKTVLHNRLSTTVLSFLISIRSGIKRKNGGKGNRHNAAALGGR